MDTDLSELLFNSMNEQGYLFQEACVQTLLKRTKSTGWDLPVYDYSVSHPDGRNTRVDIVLSRPEKNGVEAYAIVECKRANPEYSYWLFGTPDYGLPEEFHGVYLPPSGTADLRAKFHKTPIQLYSPVPMSWMEVRKGRKANQRASVPQTIEDAATQVLLGTTGVATEQLKQRSKVDSYHNRVYFFPVVLTTARLFVANYSTDDIDIASGMIAQDKVEFSGGSEPDEQRWVLINYPASESLALAGIPESLHSTNPADLDQYKLRSIFVVNANHLVNFFSQLNRTIGLLRDS